MRLQPLEVPKHHEGLGETGLNGDGALGDDDLFGFGGREAGTRCFEARGLDFRPQFFCVEDCGLDCGEILVGLLDAYLLFGEDRHIDAYENIHRFTMDHVINHKVGEWYPLFDENSNRLWDHMGRAWKINYHTVRSMIQSEARLLRITG